MFKVFCICPQNIDALLAAAPEAVKTSHLATAPSSAMATKTEIDVTNTELQVYLLDSYVWSQK